jgi:hypothetical protein
MASKLVSPSMGWQVIVFVCAHITPLTAFDYRIPIRFINKDRIVHVYVQDARVLLRHCLIALNASEFLSLNAILNLEF